MKLWQCILYAQATILGATVATHPSYAQGEARFQFELPRQPLSASIRAVASRTRTNVAFDPEVVEGRTAPPLRGSFSPRGAIEALLRGSGLVVTDTSGGSFAIVARAAQPAGAAALEAPSASDETVSQTIIVTGTRIEGQNVESIPTITYDRDDVRNSGAFTTEDFMRTVPQNFGGGRNAAAAPAAESFDNVANNARITTVNLRGLGPGATLSIVNGRRMAPVGIGGDFDISVIPASAISRIEIVPDGSSAIYGSDAIAGVVNFILRDDLHGAETGLQYGFAEDSDYHELRFNQDFGYRWGSGNAMASYEYFDRGALRANERDFAQPLVPDATLVDPSKRHSFLASVRQQIGNRLTFSLDGLYSDREGTSTVTFFPDFTQDYRVKYFTVAPTLKFELNQHLNVELGGVHGQAKEAIVAHIFGGEEPFGSENSFTSADLLFRGDPIVLPGGRANFVLGVGGRWEQQEQTGLAARPEVSRDVLTVFGELLVPIIGQDFQPFGLSRGELLIALRHEDYSDFGSTTNPKIGLSISPVAGLNLRGTYSTSFKAPRQSANPGSEFLLIARLPDPISGQRLLAITHGGVVPELKPEEARSWTTGLDWQAARGLKLNLSYYDVRFDGRIASPAPNAVAMLAEPGVYAPFITFGPDVAAVNTLLGRVTRVLNLVGPFDPADVDAIVDFRVTNIARTDTRGLDFNIDFDRDTRIGLLSARLNVNYVLSFENQAVPGGPVSDDLDTLFRPLDLRARGDLSWTRGGLHAGISVNYSDDYENRSTVLTEPVAAYTTVDLRFAYSVPEHSRAAVLRHLSVFANVRNVFGEEPPFISTGVEGLAYDGANADPFGRVISFGVRKRW